MFLRNRTSYKAVLARGHLTDDLAVGSVNFELAYRFDGQELAPAGVPSDRTETDPPDITRYPLWGGVSVTAAGTVYGPDRPPHVQPVSITVGSEIRRLIVFGERRWRRGISGELLATAPEPFEAVPLVWSRAFGGFYDVAPGVVPGSDMPHPGGRFVYPLNPQGMGLYAGPDAAVDQPLPQIERPDQLIKQCHDQPEPGGFAPCPDLALLRLPKREPARENSGAIPSPVELRTEMFAMRNVLFAQVLRLYHHATRDLIFRAIAPGICIETMGLGRTKFRFTVPPLPVRVHTRRRRAVEETTGRVRSVHIDADVSLARIVYGYPFRYSPSSPPDWVEVMP